MRRSIVLLVLLILVLNRAPLPGQEPVADRAPLTTISYQMTPPQFELTLLTMSYDERSTDIKFSPTDRLPGARGEAKLQEKRGRTEIQIELDEMKPAWSFDGDFNTWVLWSVSPEGQMDNLGEFVLDGDRGTLNVSTRMDTFGLIVTAEPHFMVDQPSPFVVLVNRDPGTSMRRPPELVQVEVTDQTRYRFKQESLENVPKARGDVSSALRQAHVAVHLAQAAGAAQLAPERFQQAQEALYRAQGGAETRAPDDPDVERMARRTVGLAAAAQKSSRHGGSRGPG